MSYQELLNEYIQSSGLSLRKIANECEKKGVSVTASYISRLQSGKMPPPSEEITKAIAEVCKQDPQKLIMQGYIDKAPKPIQQLLAEYMEKWDTLVSVVYDVINDIEPGKTEDEFKKNISKMPVETQIDVILKLYQNIEKNYLKEIDSEVTKELIDKRPVIRVPMIAISGNKILNKGYRWLSAQDVSSADEYLYIHVSSDIASVLVPLNSWLLIRKYDEPYSDKIESGSLVVATWNKKTVIARYYVEKNHIILNQGSKDDPPIFISQNELQNLNILGLITKVEYNPNAKETD